MIEALATMNEKLIAMCRAKVSAFPADTHVEIEHLDDNHGLRFHVRHAGESRAFDVSRGDLRRDPLHAVRVGMGLCVTEAWRLDGLRQGIRDLVDQ